VKVQKINEFLHALNSNSKKTNLYYASLSKESRQELKNSSFYKAHSPVKSATNIAHSRIMTHNPEDLFNMKRVQSNRNYHAK